ncbi:hypothetical protein [Pseudozobellia thermophila]|uniref:HEAT repeat-containing protein n=1 Tax=Pseudozobellia thermophila TaxID=192903 RepID=A0A1M6G4P5_9FLAO|nr:hypothetical protein [Pseudozobellia thermophila]SHJ04956.1 hypothetical protein SAMN04488513_102677 [Pseudozobellia thermophila]
MIRIALGLFFLVPLLCQAQLGPVTAFSDGAQKTSLDVRPEFFVLDWKKGTVLDIVETPMTIMVDSVGTQKINLLQNKKREPVLYSSNIVTPVCADGDCKLMHITLYWTLLGDYAGFDRSVKEPLTKHDHDEFLYADYWKLHELLQDHNSILKRRRIDELVTRPKPSEMEGVDALSGATVKEVKESVVSGALYSCYVAWHLVHGKIKEELRAYTVARQNQDMLLRMLNSANTNYQMYALENLGEEGYEAHFPRITELFRSGIPLVRSFIIKNLADAFARSPSIMQPFWEALPHIDINTRSLLLQHIDSAPDATVTAISTQLGVLTKNQLIQFLSHLEDRKSVSGEIWENLRRFAASSKEKNAYIVVQFLEDHS